MSVHSYRRGSIFWALSLIAVGGIFLWHNFNPDIHPWQMIAKFWPLVIIFWGLSKLIDYVQAQAHPATISPPLFSGSEVILLILLLVMGTLVSKIVLHPWEHTGWHINDDELEGLFLNSYTYTQSFSQPASGQPHLVLDGQHGDIEIRGADQSTLDVMAKKTIHAEDENAAKKISDELKLNFVEEAGHYLLSSNRESLGDDGRHIAVDLSLRVPTATSSEVTSDHGDIVLDGLRGDQGLTLQHSDIRAANIEGVVKIHKAGGSTEARDVKGSVELDGRGGDVDMANVSGTVTVNGEFSGSIQIRNVGQTLRYQSARTDLTAQKLSGSLEMDVGSLDVNGIDGPLELTTRQKDITVNDFKHSVRITSDNGEVSLRTSMPVTHDIQVDSKKGAIELTLPAGSNFQIEASSRHGEVECDFAGPGLKVVTEGDSPSITGSIGKGGPMIRLRTDYGAIRILRAGSPSSPPPAPNARPATPESPEHPGKVATMGLPHYPFRYTPAFSGQGR
jgi:DUF4097 and DUF4098 domain-containing protein YvlB